MSEQHKIQKEIKSRSLIIGLLLLTGLQPSDREKKKEKKGEVKRREGGEQVFRLSRARVNLRMFFSSLAHSERVGLFSSCSRTV